MWWDDYWWAGNHWPMYGMFFGPIVPIIFMVICLAMMFFMMRGRGHRSRSSHALDILKERFARGEINQAEYEERRRLLDA